MMSNSRYPNLDDQNNDDRRQVPLHRQDQDNSDLVKGYRDLNEVRNSMPPPPNPNRDSGEKDD